MFLSRGPIILVLNSFRGNHCCIKAIKRSLVSTGYLPPTQTEGDISFLVSIHQENQDKVKWQKVVRQMDNSASGANASGLLFLSALLVSCYHNLYVYELHSSILPDSGEPCRIGKMWNTGKSGV